MNEKLEQSMVKILEFIEQSAVFVQEQTPLYIQEYLNFYIFENWLEISFSILFLCVTLLLFFLSFKIKDSEPKVAVIVISAIGFFFAGVATVLNTKDLYKGYNAPRLVIVEHLKEFKDDRRR
jgi:hypothetical protein